MNKLFILFFSVLLMITPLVMQAKETIYHVQAEAEKDQYHIDVLTFLFKDDDNFQLKSISQNLSGSRQISELKNGALSVAAFGTSQSLEDDLLPIRIPILKGLLGHRIFIIKKSAQAKFDQVNTLSALQNLKAGQGVTWSDTKILKNAGFDVVTTLKYPNLFPMLEGDRFDYFPRALHEPFSEVQARPELNLTIEKRLMLVYPLALYLFVSPENISLASVVETKLEAAIADGRFDEFFYGHQLIQTVLQRSQIKERKIFRISNPDLPSNTPLERDELWLSVDNI